LASEAIAKRISAITGLTNEFKPTEKHPNDIPWANILLTTTNLQSPTKAENPAD
jgi:hypothetical protein